MNRERTYILPAAAGAKLRQAEKDHFPVYIYGMTGFGKTALVEHFLEKKPYTRIDAETAQAEDFDGVFREPAVGNEEKILVIDNLQFADKELLAERIPELLYRSDLWLILISRARCPGYLMNYRFKGSGFVEITEQELALSEDETQEFFRRQGLPLEREALGVIHRWSRGHGMGLRILADLWKQGNEASDDMISRSEQLFCDYLEAEVFDRWEPYYAATLCQLSVVDSFTKEMAVYITGNPQMELVLKYAMETGNFLQIHEGEYHLDAILVKSMRRRLEKRCSRERVDELYSNAGRYYRQHGEYKKALELFAGRGNTAQIKDILMELSRKQPGSARIYVYKPYYQMLSDEEIAGSPELMCGMSMVCSITMNVEKSEYWYECLKQAAKTGAAGMRKKAEEYVAYLTLALPHRGSRDSMEIIKALAKQLTSRSFHLNEFSVTGNSISNMNGGKDFCEWSKRDLELAVSVGPIVSLILGDYGKGLVDLCVAESFFEKGHDDYEVIRRASRGLMQADGGTIEERLVGIGIMARLHTHRGHLEDSRALLESVYTKCERENTLWLIPNILNYLCQLDLYSGNTWNYQNWMNTEAPTEEDFIITERYRYLTKIRIYLILGKYAQAHSLIERMLYYADVYDRPYIGMESEILLAILQYRQGNEQWKTTLQQVYTRAEQYHFVRILSKEAGAVLELFRNAKLVIADAVFYDQVMQELKSMDSYYPSYLKGNSFGESFSENALRVLRLQAEGRSNEDIAAEMNISVSTVKYHCRENYAKLGVKNRSGAVAEAHKRKLIP